MLRIVLVDDERVVLDGVEHLLREAGEAYTVLGKFDESPEAMAFIRGHAAQIDLVMTDIRMPELSGVELIRETKRLRPEIVLVAMSAYTDYEYIRQAMKNGAEDYLLKPCRRQELLKIFEKAETAKLEKMAIQRREQREKALRGLLEEDAQAEAQREEQTSAKPLCGDAADADSRGRLRAQTTIEPFCGDMAAAAVQREDTAGQPEEALWPAGTELFCAVYSFPEADRTQRKLYAQRLREELPASALVQEGRLLWTLGQEKAPEFLGGGVERLSAFGVSACLSAGQRRSGGRVSARCGGAWPV